MCGWHSMAESPLQPIASGSRKWALLSRWKYLRTGDVPWAVGSLFTLGFLKEPAIEWKLTTEQLLIN